MPDRNHERESLSVGQLAKRWGIGAERVRQLIEAGQLPEAFTIPSAGRYGETVKIPYSTVLAAEERWQIVATDSVQRSLRRQLASVSDLKHFPELNPEPGAECYANDPRQDADSGATSG